MVEVNVGECRCPGAPHPDGDVVTLRDKLGLAAGIELQQRFRNFMMQDPRPSFPEIVGLLTEGYLLVGVTDWNFTDDLGPILVSRESIARYLLEDFERSQPVADAADGLYYEPVLSPLVASLSTSLRATSSSRSTPATNGSSRKPRKRSKRSSTTTSPTVATGTTT